MAETVPGGVYRVGDEFQNANGEKVPAPKIPPTQPDPNAGATAGTQSGPGLTGGGGKEGGDAAWPDGFPSADLLQDAGVRSAADAQGMSREELVALPGIGPARADQILGWRAQG
jgi:hypothetical protein